MAEPMPHDFPPHFGVNFTKTLHAKAEGPTDPLNVHLPSNFVVIITGAGRGIGYHTSLAFASAGAHGICISSRTPSELDVLSAEIDKVNPNAIVLARRCDVTDDADVEKLATAVKERFGRVDAVISNAGFTTDYIDKDTSNRRFPRGAVEDKDFDKIVNINLLGAHHVAQYFIPLLADTRDGVQSFINITSLASHLPFSQFTPMAFNVSKFATNRMIEQIALDHSLYGVLAFSLHPGNTVTPGSKLHSVTKGDFWEKGECITEWPYL